MPGVVLLALTLAAASQLAAPTPIDAAVVRALAIKAVGDANGDPEVAIRALDDEVAQRWGAVLVEPLSISDAPTEIKLFSPYAAYRKSILELVRRKQPIEPLPYSPIGVVIVSPVRVDAPDVTAIVVRRNGEEVRPVANNLVVRPITSSMGVTENLHAGFLAFPAGAFAPGAEVTVTAIVDGGAPLTLTLEPAALSRFR